MADTLFYSPDIATTGMLSEQESQHAVKVLRLSEGDKLAITDGKGYWYDCTIVQAHHKRCMVEIEQQTLLPKAWKPYIHLAFAPTKNNDRNEWFVEKATEIGVDRITPLKCDFSERKEIKKERLDKIAVVAMKQSQQCHLPVIDEMTPFDSFISQAHSASQFIAHCYDEEKRALANVYQHGQDAIVLIGPEGDFSTAEVTQALSNGFVPISLGNTRLRTETACVVAVHTLQVINQLIK